MYQQTLHSNWQFQAPDSSEWLQAVVPGCIHKDLLRHELIPDPFYGRNEFDLQWIEERDWNYKLAFIASPALLQHEVIDLVCDGLDTVATVRLNGEVVLQSENMFHRHRVPVNGNLRDGENILEVSFGSPLDYIRTHRTEFSSPEFNDPIGGCTRIRKQQCQFGWDWGPRFVTSGIWRDIRLEGWTANRIESVVVRQKHSVGRVDLNFVPELAIINDSAHYLVTLTLDGSVVAKIEGTSGELACAVADPQLWWPAGQGEQPLYEVQVELMRNGQVHDTWMRRIGLRTIELDQEPDEYDVKDSNGRPLNRFGLRVNGRLIFAKGANWIPAHSFVADLSRADYEPLLRDAAAANMNLMRLWGGGIYEHEAFYDICDELGLLVWNDFMFACTLYPADKEFLESVRREATDQVKRIRHHASLAMWCGNNELVALNGEILRDDESKRSGYVSLFLETLPSVLAETDPVTPYIHTSPLHTIPGSPETAAPSHDEHDWSVWHKLEPVGYYETTSHRFNSEFGMQSYPSPEVAATFCPPEELNILSPTFEAHQKHGGGNAIISHYVAQNFRYPTDYEAVSYLSQLNQAIAMKTAIEHFRRQQPQCLGALYWQLNDCWPVASWSSMEFGGRWKALHHYARRFFSPALVSIKLHGDDKAGIGNRRINTRGVVDLWTVYDGPDNREATLNWQLCTLSGEVVESGTRDVSLVYGQAVVQQNLDFTAQLDGIGKDNAYLLVRLHDTTTGEEISRNVTLFTVPRYLRLEHSAIHAETNQISDGELQLKLSADTFHYGVSIDVGPGARLSDNYIDLCPGESRLISIKFDDASSRPTVTPRFYSLIDTF